MTLYHKWNSLANASYIFILLSGYHEIVCIDPINFPKNMYLWIFLLFTQEFRFKIWSIHSHGHWLYRLWWYWWYYWLLWLLWLFWLLGLLLAILSRMLWQSSSLTNCCPFFLCLFILPFYVYVLIFFYYVVKSYLTPLLTVENSSVIRSTTLILPFLSLLTVSIPPLSVLSICTLKNQSFLWCMRFPNHLLLKRSQINPPVV